MNKRTENNMVKIRKMTKEGKWIGHIMRNNEWIIKIIEGKVGRGRPRTSFINQIIEDIGRITYNKNQRKSIKVIEPIYRLRNNTNTLLSHKVLEYIFKILFAVCMNIYSEFLNTSFKCILSESTSN